MNKLWAIRILPCPRRVIEAKTADAAEALYRQRYQISRRDLEVQLEEVDERQQRGPLAASAG